MVRFEMRQRLIFDFKLGLLYKLSQCKHTQTMVNTKKKDWKAIHQILNNDYHLAGEVPTKESLFYI